MWMKCENLQKASIVRCLSKLIPILNEKSQQIYPIILPIIDYSTDILKPEQILMTIEDGLMLWRCTIQYSSVITKELMNLFSHILSIIECDFSHLMIAISITDGYLLLGKNEFLNVSLIFNSF
jgi:hypothetical protein